MSGKGKVENDLVHCVKTGAWSHLCLICFDSLRGYPSELQAAVAKRYCINAHPFNLQMLKEGCVYNDNMPLYESRDGCWGHEAEWYLLFLKKCAL